MKDTVTIQRNAWEGEAMPFVDTLINLPQRGEPESLGGTDYFEPSDASPSPGVPFDFALHSAYPNPFNPSTTIAFALPSEQLVKIAIHDIQGREVAQLVNSRLSAGEHVVEWNASRFASGTYFATLHAGKWQAQTKLTLLK
ncbi:MAG: T9SS type A sorting domain-containing protein [bacterium]|nr:T9SS type A sorting domain-containing protein [bacterium]